MSRVTISMADVILSGRCWIFLIFSAYTMFLMYPPQGKNQVERDLGFEVARVLVRPFQSRHQGISHLKRQSQETEMGRSSVLHKNNPTYSFLFEGFNLWKHVLFKL